VLNKTDPRDEGGYDDVPDQGKRLRSVGRGARRVRAHA
jgi:hypothetical protein